MEGIPSFLKSADEELFVCDVETSWHGPFAIVDSASESSYGSSQGTVVRLFWFSLELDKLSVFPAIKDNIPWTAFVVAAAAL